MNKAAKIYQNSGYINVGIGPTGGATNFRLNMNLSRYFIKQITWTYRVDVAGQFLTPDNVTNQSCDLLVRDVNSIQVGNPLTVTGLLGGSSGGFALYYPGEYNLDYQFSNSIILQVNTWNADVVNNALIWVSLIVRCELA